MGLVMEVGEQCRDGDVDDGGKKEEEREGPFMYTDAPQRQKQGTHPAPPLRQTSFPLYSNHYLTDWIVVTTSGYHGKLMMT